MSIKSLKFCTPTAGLVVLLFCNIAFSEKVLIYDEEKGILLIDKDNPQNPSVQKKETNTLKNQLEKSQGPSDGKTVDATIQRGRQKDPPSVYFEPAPVF